MLRRDAWKKRPKRCARGNPQSRWFPFGSLLTHPKEGYPQQSHPQIGPLIFMERPNKGSNISKQSLFACHSNVKCSQKHIKQANRESLEREAQIYIYIYVYNYMYGCGSKKTPEMAPGNGKITRSTFILSHNVDPYS